MAWRWPTAIPGAVTEQPVTVDRVRSVAGHASAMMWTLACLAILSAGGEVWRYVLLVESRTGALSSRLVGASDAVVTIAAILTLAFSVVAIVVVLWWLHLARHAAATVADQSVARKNWHVVAYLLIPGLNLAMAGVVLTELEHQVLRRPATDRPVPSKPVRIWWAAWVGAGLLFAATIIWRFRHSVQAHADGVLLTALTDLAAATVAILTAMMVRRISTLLAPINPANVRFMRVLRVDNAPDPELRTAKTVPSKR